MRKFSLSQVNIIWSACQSKLPKNIFNFTIRYINNTLLTRRNLAKWGLSSTADCSFCLNPESLLHVVAGCNSYLNRFTWRHDSVLNFIANNILQPIHSKKFYVVSCYEVLINKVFIIIIIMYMTCELLTCTGIKIVVQGIEDSKYFSFAQLEVKYSENTSYSITIKVSFIKESVSTCTMHCAFEKTQRLFF